MSQLLPWWTASQRLSWRNKSAFLFPLTITRSFSGKVEDIILTRYSQKYVQKQFIMLNREDSVNSDVCVANIRFLNRSNRNLAQFFLIVAQFTSYLFYSLLHKRTISYVDMAVERLQNVGVKERSHNTLLLSTSEKRFLRSWTEERVLAFRCGRQRHAHI